MPAGPSAAAPAMLADSLGELVNDFVADVARLAREAALASVERTFPSGKAPAARASRPAPRAVATPGDDARTGAAIVSFLAANPEQMPRDIAAALGLSRESIASHLSSLLASRKVRADGHGRGRRYWASGRASSRAR
jgi:DNA-binding transcriptional ArsR family regulator